MMQRLRLAFTVLFGNAGPTTDHVDRIIADTLAEMRHVERQQREAREQLEDAVRMKWLTASRDNIARRPEVNGDDHRND